MVVLLGQRLRFFDTTLRDGEQTPGVSLTPQQKLEIAIKLDEIGIDVIEAGSAVASVGEREAIKLISQALESMKLYTSGMLDEEIILLEKALDKLSNCCT